MDRESELYRFARVEGYRITMARLVEQFKDRTVNLEEMEDAVRSQLAGRALCTPWRRTEIDQAGCREGMRRAGLQFLSQYREVMRNLRSSQQR